MGVKDVEIWWRRWNSVT